MGDAGWLDREGRLWFCGRKSHRVASGDSVLFTDEVEPIFNRHPRVRRTALVKTRRGGSESGTVLCVELEPEHRNADRRQIEKELIALGAEFPHTRDIRRFLFHPGFPVDVRHNAKIFREKLAVWASKELR